MKCVGQAVEKRTSEPLLYTWGALHKIGRFRNVPTVGTFVNKFNFNLLINVPTVGTFRKQPILCNAPLFTLTACYENRERERSRLKSDAGRSLIPKNFHGENSASARLEFTTLFCITSHRHKWARAPFSPKQRAVNEEDNNSIVPRPQFFSSV